MGTPGFKNHGVSIHGRMESGFEEILTPDALQFVSELHHRFEGRRRELLDARRARQAAIDAGEMPDFLPGTASVRESEWTVAPIPADLEDRRVEITGPVERKMVINALNSGANVFMADFEDSNSPTWSNNVQGQLNLRDAVRGIISYTSPEGKHYALGPKTAVLLVRPRGWHLVEKHATVNGQPISASLFDFGLYFFHNAKALLAKGTGAYFYLPKMQSHLEARLWNDAFVFAQDYLAVPQGSIRATVLIETILAAFEMHEILWELRNHSGGLNCGRWDYIFSFIKVFRNRSGFVMPDRAQVTMTTHFLNSYVLSLIQTCHRRGIHAMGGMAAQIPIKNDPSANESALEKVRQDKLREVKAGHDGTWVAHPGLVPIAKGVFDAHMTTPNQIHIKRDDVGVSASDLLAVPQGAITEAGLKLNIDVGIQYLESWLMGNGCVPIYNLMEDAATAEISRTQVWQWLRHGAVLNDGRKISWELIRQTIAEQLAHIRGTIGPAGYDSGRFPEAATLFEQMMFSDQCPEFLTLAAYDRID
ncbi:MAG TPA: malate synthase A [Bryobacteraceae bacterium]|nr:malate synthase A [Bryobacteraceae bacterium]